MPNINTFKLMVSFTMPALVSNNAGKCGKLGA